MKFIFNFCLLFFFCSCAMAPSRKEKINGVSFVASRDSITPKHINPVKNVNANYASVMPFGFIKDLAHPEIIFNADRQWFGETRTGAKQYIEALKKQDIKVMMKPQIWVSRGAFTGYIKMENDEDWKDLEDSYSKFIIEYAHVAQEAKADILCIGTELENFIDHRPEYWEQLIVEVKKIYKGKLTYAANWNEFNRTPFWDDLDYIGIDAYFPLSDKKTPTLQDCKDGWQVHKTLLKNYSQQLNKPILFTEFGYRSVDYAAKAPWKSDRDMTIVNFEAQNNAMQSLFEEVWKEDWIAGGFVWKWFHNHERSGGLDNSQFTPQNKPVESIIRAQYELK
jgi:hypothetical protein